MQSCSLKCLVLVTLLVPFVTHTTQAVGDDIDAAARLAKYATVRLTADVGSLTPAERAMLPHLIEAARQMNNIFWQQAYGNGRQLLSKTDNRDLRRLLQINYGPWDRLDDNCPLVAGMKAKPAGANFYPPNLTREDFNAFLSEQPERTAEFKSLYTMVRRGEQGKLRAVPYHQFFSQPLKRASDELRKAAELAENSQLKHYLELRASALLSDQYQASDIAWLDMKTNRLDIVIGPIETYEDQLFGYKAANEAYVLIKDEQWSRQLSRYASMLPSLQRSLPVPEAYKKETPGTDSDLNAYDVIFYAGDANAGSKTIAINLPNDEEVQLTKGTRRLQLKNAMRAKFDRIMLPIAKSLLVPEQVDHVTFDAFFANTMFHEVAHGLGIKNTLNGRGTVRSSMREMSSTLEEGKADVLGLYLVSKLRKDGVFEGGQMLDHYVTFVASIFRSIRFGASSAHGRANLIRFNYFAEKGAFERTANGHYRIDPEKTASAMTSLSERILRLQGDGDYEGAKEFLETYGEVGPSLDADLQRLESHKIPVDVVFQQGAKVLGL